MKLNEFLKLSDDDKASLQDLHLQPNNLRALTTYELQSFCCALAKCRSLQFIGLFNNNLFVLTPEAWQVLGGALANCTNLQHLDLKHNDGLKRNNGVEYKISIKLNIENICSSSKSPLIINKHFDYPGIEIANRQIVLAWSASLVYFLKQTKPNPGLPAEAVRKIFEYLHSNKEMIKYLADKPLNQFVEFKNYNDSEHGAAEKQTIRFESSVGSMFSAPPNSFKKKKIG